MPEENATNETNEHVAELVKRVGVLNRGLKDLLAFGIEDEILQAVDSHRVELSALSADIGLARQSIDRLFSVFSDEKDLAERFVFKPNLSAREKNIFVVLQVFSSALNKCRSAIEDLLKEPSAKGGSAPGGKKCIVTELESSKKHPFIHQLLGHLVNIDRNIEKLHRAVDRRGYLDIRKTLKSQRPTTKKASILLANTEGNSQCKKKTHRSAAKKNGGGKNETIPASSEKSKTTPEKPEVPEARPVKDFRAHIEKNKGSFGNELNYEIACEIAMSLEDQVAEEQGKFQTLLSFDDLWEFFRHSNGNYIPIHKFSKQLKALKQELLVLGILLKGTAQAGGKTPFNMEWGQ